MIFCSVTWQATIVNGGFWKDYDDEVIQFSTIFKFMFWLKIQGPVHNNARVKKRKEGEKKLNQI
jgi:hypothetical protein